jgi:hypothetical protein
MNPLPEYPSLLSRIERFAAVHLDPDPEVQASFMQLVEEIFEAGEDHEARHPRLSWT